MITITFRREQKSIDYYKYTPFSIDTLHLYEYTGIIDINNIDSYIETNFILGHSKNYSNHILTHIYVYDKTYDYILITEDSLNYNDVRINIRNISIDKILQ